MQKLFDMFTEPVFWVGTVLVGFILNLLSAWVGKRLDAWYDQRRERSAQRLSKRAIADATFRAKLFELEQDSTLVLASLIEAKQEEPHLFGLLVALLSQLAYFLIEYQHKPAPYTYSILVGFLLCLVFFLALVRRRAARSLLLSVYAHKVRQRRKT